MARSIDTIYREIITSKESKPELDSLDSASATAIYRIWAYVTASVIFTLETLFDLFRAEVEGIILSQKPGSLLWYRAMCLGFRYGVGLVVINGRVGYPASDSTPALLAQCSVREAADGLVIKVAKEVSSQLQPLALEELNSFSAYVSAIKYAGTPTRIINIAANLLMVEATVYYDPLIIKANGEAIADGSRPVDTAIESYLRELPFDGRLKQTSLVEAVMSTPGVLDLKIASLQHKYESYGYESIEVSHIPESGYFKIDPSAQLSSTIQYIPYV